MKNSISLILIFLVCVIFSACLPEFTNPLSDPQNAKIDKRLLGTWFTKNIRENVNQDVYVHFEIDKEYPKLLNAELKIINNNKHKIDEENKIRITLFSVFTTESMNNYYLNIKENKHGKLVEYYIIIKYEIKNGKLEVLLIDEEKLEKELENNKIVGSSKKGGLFYQIHITDGGQNILKLLEANNKMFISVLELKKIS